MTEVLVPTLAAAGAEDGLAAGEAAPDETGTDRSGTGETGTAEPGTGEPAGPATDAERPHGPSLSPSRAADFMTCPLLYRFRVVDRLPEPPSPAAARGTLVHAVLERLFDEPPPAARQRPQGRCSARSGPASWPRNPRWPRCSRPKLSTRYGSKRRRGCWTATSPWKTRQGSSRPTARCQCKPCSTPVSHCAVTSTGSTSRRPARSGSSTTRPERRHGKSTRPGRYSR